MPDNLNTITCIFIRRRQREFETNPYRGEAMWRQRQRLEWCGHKLRKPAPTRSWERLPQNTRLPVVGLREFRGIFKTCSQRPDSHLGFCWGWAFVICAFLCYFKNMHKKMKMFWGCEKWSLFTFLHSICRQIPQQAIFLTLLFAQCPALCLTQSTCPVRMLGEWMSFHIICLLRILSSEFHIYILFLFPWAPEAAESAIEGESWAGAGAALPRT